MKKYDNIITEIWYCDGGGFCEPPCVLIEHEPQYDPDDLKVCSMGGRYYDWVRLAIPEDGRTMSNLRRALNDLIYEQGVDE